MRAAPCWSSNADATPKHGAPNPSPCSPATAAPATPTTAPRPDGAGLRAAIEAALTDAGACADDVDHINAHGTSTALNDRTEAAVVRALFAARHPPVTSAKGALGHTMGAAGAIEAALTVLTITRGTIPPTANFGAPDDSTAGIDIVVGATRGQRLGLALSHSLGFGGHNTVLALTPA
ncbi:hypothetical protein [Streptomyces sp. NPDC059010]|uniref:hypothetical protein n=1 Tax=Streptomyces sp. NPDC059010 TaxID=3346695 RepID=UPI00367A27E1